MEIFGRIKEWLSPTIRNLCGEVDAVARWRAGTIVTASGRLVHARQRWMRYKASQLRVWWDKNHRERSIDRCQLFFHQAPGAPDFLVVGYVAGGEKCSLSTFYCALVALDEIARIKGSHAIVAEATNSRLSDRLFRRWGWERHCLNLRGRHYIKRFYGKYPSIGPLWLARIHSVDSHCEPTSS